MPMSERPLTANAQKVARALLADPDGEHIAVDLARAIGMSPITVGQTLARFVDQGVLTQRYGTHGTRPVRFTPGGPDALRDVLNGVHPLPLSTIRPTYAAAAERPTREYHSLADLRAAVTRGDESHSTLNAFLRRLGRAEEPDPAAQPPARQLPKPRKVTAGRVTRARSDA